MIPNSRWGLVVPISASLGIERQAGQRHHGGNGVNQMADGVSISRFGFLLTDQRPDAIDPGIGSLYSVRTVLSKRLQEGGVARGR